MGNFFKDMGTSRNPWDRLKSHRRLSEDRELKKLSTPIANPIESDTNYAKAVKLLSEEADTGFTQADTAKFNQMQARAQQAVGQNQQALAAEMRKRGQVGSGLEYSGQQQMLQAGAQNASDIATDRATQAEENRRRAVTELAGLSTDKANAQTQIDMFNKQSRENRIDADQNRRRRVGANIASAGASAILAAMFNRK